MIKLSESNYFKIKQLINSKNELSVFSVIDGIIPGDIFTDNENNPKVALIKTPECNLIAGMIDNKFITEISSELDFWDSITPDSQEWFNQIPLLHKNKFIYPFKRRHYLISQNLFIKKEISLPAEFVLEKVNIELLRYSNYKNADKILEWAAEWGESFYEKGVGNYIRNNETIVSWSLGDCSYSDQIAIGVKTDEKYRKQGFGFMVVSETVNECFDKGYKIVNWLCVDSNRGSINIAEKLGFRYNNDYYFFCSYLPTENLLDISEEDWFIWAKYLEESSKHEPRLLNECLYTYLKANNVLKTIEIINLLSQFKKAPDINNINNDIHYFQSIGLCSNFNNSDWSEFINLYDLSQ